ncbi:MAG TPA: exonuclease domain-containing protein [Burkholderiales bacterium]|nr:exonuclease domain-containing protein [Burkholderiales bacterium]
MRLDAPLAIVDLETTGGSAAHDRVTEIAVLEVDGFEVTSEWSTLVNPETTIPGAIQALTGITNDMVAGAPRFSQLAEELFERLSGRVFIAHNARFDYGFLRREFERTGRRFQAKTLCTVRLSRRLYPQHREHNLDSVIARHRIACQARHRALGDADALWQFLRIAADEHGPDILAVAARQITRRPSLPPHIDRAVIDAIPEAPGVYLFYGEAGSPLYVGKSKSLRTRVLSHFSADMRSGRSLRLAQEVRRIEWQRTAGELGALLREARLVKELAPAYNRQLQRPEGLCGFVFDGTRLRLAGAAEIDGDTLPLVRGLFRSRRAATAALRVLADADGLCLQTLGFDASRRGACFRHQIARCRGVCAGKENPHFHLARVAAALARFPGAAQWPHDGPLAIVERDRDRDAEEVHVVDRWCYLGSARSDEEVHDLLACREPAPFDYDHYRILERHLGKRGVRTLPLSR